LSSLKRNNVAIIADWDADGAVSAAVLVYSQKYEGVYPVKKSLDIDLYPSEPYGAFKRLDTLYCYESLVFLDIPVIKISIDQILIYRDRCKDTKIIYIDHHLSTHRELDKLMKIVDEALVGYVPTSKIAYDRILMAGARTNQRLEKFVSTIYYMDQGLKVPEDLRRIMRLLADVSKYMAYKKDEETWIKIVNWMAPRIVHSYLDHNVLTKIRGYVEKIDQEMKSFANEIAVSAQRIGVFRFIDARKKWRRKGASSLASVLYRIFRAPVAVIVSDPHEPDKALLIIKYPGKAYKIARYIEERGLLISIGGHPSLAIIRFDLEKLGEIKDLLNKIRI
jgi:single-stranded DNA-specific DHH superfamily exonuclease